MTSSIYLRQLSLGPMKNFIYLLGGAGEREVAVIDPAWDAEAILRAAAEDQKVITTALLTHHHHDHVNALEPLSAALPDLRSYAQDAELTFAPSLAKLGRGVRAVGPSEVVEVGSLKVTCVHTPGHTPGSQCFSVDEALVSGDTLFIGGCGRCDFKGGDPEQMFQSLHHVLAKLPGETVLFPGHDYAATKTSTIAAEKATNPYLQRDRLEDFVELRMRPRA